MWNYRFECQNIERNKTCGFHTTNIDINEIPTQTLASHKPHRYKWQVAPIAVVWYSWLQNIQIYLVVNNNSDDNNNNNNNFSLQN